MEPTSQARNSSSREIPTDCSLQDFKHVKNIGSGSFGRVTLVQYLPTGKLYACKTMSKRKIIALRQVQHVRNEKSILAEMECPFIIQLRAFLQDEEKIYLFLDFVQGGELFSHLRRYGKFPVEVVKFYAAEIILALAYMHSKDILYRDLKLENLLLDNQGHIKLTDLGFAKRIAKDELAFSVVGTPEYISPEILKHLGHDKSTDWWSFGVLLYEMLCGYPPFYDESPDMTCKKILAGKISFPKSIDRVSIDLVLRLLNPDKNKRLGSSLAHGAKDIMSHPFFNNINWEWFEKRFVRAPILPKVKDSTDCSNYEEYLDDKGEFPVDEDEIDFDNAKRLDEEELAGMGYAPIPHSQAEVDKNFEY